MRRALFATGVALVLAASTAGGAENLAPPVAVAPQYDTTHVYVAPEEVDRFVASFLATFGGQSSAQAVTTVTPTPSSTISQLLRTPVGALSVFGYKTPIPYPFGSERTGYLVTDLDAAIDAARAAGADVLVAPFSDPIGRDAIIQWPGGVDMQLYWHFSKPSYGPLATVPENRVYLSPDAADSFVRGFLGFSGGRIVSDDPRAPGVEVGRPGESYRRIRLESDFGRVTALVTDGRLPYPYGREVAGYEVADLSDTLARAKAAGVRVLVEPYTADGREAALVEFPGGSIAEIHAPARR